MLFNSYQFLIFFLVVAVAYFSLAHRRQLVLLLVASFYFYMCWRPEYILLILAQTVLSYTCALKISAAGSKRLRTLWLWFDIAACVSLLGYFKYLGFLTGIGRSAASIFGIHLFGGAYDILLPLGISFHTFQTMGYIIDVYRGTVPAERRLFRMALFVTFFPQMVAGPIERASGLLPQFDRTVRFDPHRINSGLALALWGLFKKVVIADRLAVYVNSVYGAPTAHGAATLAMATYFFTFQIYCDFSGYSDIAVGIARVLGYDLTQNFKLPYFSGSISEFWSRWHISLSTWFRDYVYIPLGGSRVPFWLWMRNIMVVFALSGLWHGARWTFVVWGALHGVYYLLERLAGGLRSRLLPTLPAGWAAAYRWGGRVITFNLVAIAWVFFRAPDLSTAAGIVKSIVLWKPGALYWGSSSVQTALGACFILLLLALEAAFASGLPGALRRRLVYAPQLAWAGYAVLLLVVAFLGVGTSTFIYFQF